MRNKKIVLALVLSSCFLLASPAYAQWSVYRLGNFGLPQGSIYYILRDFLNWILAILGTVGIIGFAISGIMYLTAAGDEGRIGTAKKAMTYSIIGVVVGISGLVIIQAVHFALSGFMFF